MHSSSIENMQKCYERFLSQLKLIEKSSVSVLDISQPNGNGSFTDIFSDSKFRYVTIDILHFLSEKNMEDVSCFLPFHSSSIDIVICGQVFEHVDFFWLLFKEMIRVLHEDGIVFLIVPSSGPIHRNPIDCYRFYPDSMTALARYAKIELITSWLDDRGPSCDLVGVFAYPQTKTIIHESKNPPLMLPINKFMEQTMAAPLFNSDSTNEMIEVTSGQMHYLDFIKKIHTILKPKLYLEIGVRQGASLALAECPAFAVDPQPDVRYELPPHHALYKKTSDLFFENDALEVLGKTRPDLVFIDGMHLFEFALRDFINVERYSSPTTLIIVDDISPCHKLQAERRRQSRVWTGDVWKLYDCLKEMRPDLSLVSIDVAPTGLLLIKNLDPQDTVLVDNYNTLIQKYSDMTISDRSDIISRTNSISPYDPIIEKIISSNIPGNNL